MTAIEDAGQVRVQDAMPFVDGGLGNRLEHAYTSVVDQDVEPTELRDGLGHQRFHIRVTAYIGTDTNHAAGVRALEALDGLFDMTRGASADHDRRAFTQQRVRDGQSDPA